MALPPKPRQEQNGRKAASFVRTNYKIRVPEVRVVDSAGKMLGVMPTRKAQALAESMGLDLVEITPNAQPPLCKIMDYGKFRYEESIRQKQARKNAKATQVKEIKFHSGTDVGDLNRKFHSGTDVGDLNRKVKEILGFIEQGNKVKISLKFRGRENAHRELGIEMIENVISLCAEKTTVEQAPKLVGRDLSALLAPKSTKGGARKAEQPQQPAPKPTPGLSPTQPPKAKGRFAPRRTENRERRTERAQARDGLIAGETLTVSPAHFSARCQQMDAERKIGKRRGRTYRTYRTTRTAASPLCTAAYPSRVHARS